MIKNTLLDILFPPRCAVCDKIRASVLPVCKNCEALILHPKTYSVRCNVCFMELKDCICKKHQYYDKLCIPLIYTGNTKKTLLKFKFEGRPDLAKSYGLLLRNALAEREMLGEKIDIITYIPITKKTRLNRGYNQSQLIAEELSRLTGIECVELLSKIINTKSQHDCTKLKRSGNVLGVFEPKTEMLDKIKDKNILVVDDIFTTGSTINEIAKTLLIFDAGRVFASCVAITKK